jgi:asparagine synthetase B (glutamine-hydrolysing)
MQSEDDMRLQYYYQDRYFDDIRDVVHNNKLEVNYTHIFEEYLPFQVFMTGETFFKGVKVIPTVAFEPDHMGRPFSEEFFDEAVADYLTRTGYNACSNPAAAVSGGVDSSVVALHLKPWTIYSGYYGDEGCDETEYSELVADQLYSEHKQFELTEEDFFHGLEDYLDTVCTPVAGMGGVMEYITLQKMLDEDPGVDGVLFGNGGDELFLGYYFNHFVREFYFSAQSPYKYMPNFTPMKSRITKQMLDIMLVASINRMGTDRLQSKLVRTWLLPRLGDIRNVYDKLLHININMTLPSLLHVNQQICRACGVKGFNPLANEMFIRNASRINMPADEIPKQKLRELKPELPEKIRTNYIKRGFPIPLRRWSLLDKYFKDLWEEFALEDWHVGTGDYPGLNRVSWAIANIMLFLKRYR